MFCTRTLWCKSRIFSGSRQRNNYRHQNFFNFCLLPNQCRGGRNPSAHSFASHQHFHASGGVSPLSLAERQVAGGGHMETNNLSHLRSHLCQQLSRLFSVHPRGTNADPDLVGESTHCCCEVATTVGTAMTKTTFGL